MALRLLAEMLYSDWKAGRVSSYRQYIDQIAQFLNVSPTYLIRGEEESFNPKYEDDERELICLYRFLNADSKSKILRMAGALAANA